MPYQDCLRLVYQSTSFKSGNMVLSLLAWFYIGTRILTYSLLVSVQVAILPGTQEIQTLLSLKYVVYSINTTLIISKFMKCKC